MITASPSIIADRPGRPELIEPRSRTNASPSKSLFDRPLNSGRRRPCNRMYAEAIKISGAAERGICPTEVSIAE